MFLTLPQLKWNHSMTLYASYGLFSKLQENYAAKRELSAFLEYRVLRPEETEFLVYPSVFMESNSHQFSGS